MTVVVRGMIVFLAALYLYVTYIVTHPNVSVAYRDYYILRSTDISIAQLKKLPPLQIGHDYTHKVADIAFDGWSVPEDAFRWNDGKTAKLIFTLSPESVAQAPHRLVIDLVPHGEQRTRWWLNGKDLGWHQIAGDMKLTLSLSPGVLRARENVVEIEMPDAHRPNESDGRRLGLAFKSLRLE